jgi:small subunit ribosomal protein S20
VISLPQRRSAIKELRKNRKNKMRNQDIKTDIKKTVKKFLSSVESKDTKEAEIQLKSVYKKIDKATKRNILHKNTAARRKSKFCKILNTPAAK